VGALVVDSVGNGLFLPLSLVYFVRLTPVPLAVVGVVLSIASLVPLPVPIWAGQLVDRFGPKPVVVGSQVLQAAGYAAFTVVQNPLGILVAASAVGVGVRFFWSAVFALIADFAERGTTGRTKDSWFTLANIARTVGLAVGGLLTGVLVASGASEAYRATAWCAAGSFVLAAVLLVVAVSAPHVRPHEDDRGEGYAGLVRDRPFLALILVNTVLALSSFFLPLALPTVVTQQLGAPAWVTSALLAGNAVLVALLSAPLVRRAAGTRRTRVLVVAGVLWAGGSLLLALLAATGPGFLLPLLVVGTLLFPVAESIHAPVSQTLAEAVAPRASRGRYLATFQYSFAIASIIGPGFFAVLFEIAHPLPWIGLALLDVAALGLDCEAASARLLGHKVAATPMRGWGGDVADRHVRFVFSREPVERLRLLGERVQAALRT
jgi:MFS family permease